MDYRRTAAGGGIVNGHEGIPDRVECVQRALNYLFQAERTIDQHDPTQNALIGIGYAILAATTTRGDGK